MSYQSLIQLNEQFQSSINLEFDFNKLDKINGYIPVDQAISILGDFLKTIYGSSHERASVLVGPYGRGKSHLVLVLLALVSLNAHQEQKEIREALRKLVEKINRVDEGTGALASALIDAKKPMLPVLINSNNANFQQALLLALHRALEREGLQQILPHTYFDVAIDMVHRWEEQFADAYEKLDRDLSAYGLTADQLCAELKRYSVEAYNLFCKIYPDIVMGTEFNPLLQSDALALYREVNHILCEQYNYLGTFIVFDEFSKFLEANSDKTHMDQFKMLQDFAEMCSRSGPEQMHLVCITHKDLIEYSHSDSFRTIEARFKHIYFTATSEHNYELIANAIIKKQSFAKFRNRFREEFEQMKLKSQTVNLFPGVSEEFWDRVLIDGCFPLSPVTAYALLRVSGIVAQNERTLFTFLSSHEPATMYEFIEKTEENTFSAIAVDYVFDFFQDLFRKEIFNEQVHSAWAKASTALKANLSPQEARLVKTIAIINIINDGQLKPVTTHIKAAALLPDQDFEAAVSNLIKKKVLVKRSSNSQYAFLTANGIDIRKNIKNYIAANLRLIDSAQVLNEINQERFIYPRQYNNQYHMLRYYEIIFMEAAITNLSAVDLLQRVSADGVLCRLIWEKKEERDAAVEHIKTFEGFPEIVFCIPRTPFSAETSLKEYLAIQALKDSAEAHVDPHYATELEVFEEDAGKSLAKYITNIYDIELGQWEFHNCDGEIEHINKSTLFNRKLSEIFDTVYSKTAVINNEMVNRKNLTAPIRKARNEVVTHILTTGSGELSTMQGFSPEATIFRALVLNKGLLSSEPLGDKALEDSLEQIQTFIQGCEHEKKTLDPIVRLLMKKPYGMRQGLLPVYFAFELRGYAENAVFYLEKKELDITAESLERAIESPEKYSLKIEAGTLEKREYISQLDQLFEKEKLSADPIGGSIYADIVWRMQSWIRALPRCARENVGLLGGEQAVIRRYRKELLQYDVNPREILFNTIPETVECGEDLKLAVQRISDIKDCLEQYFGRLEENLSMQVMQIVNPTYQGTLPYALKTWYERLEEASKRHLYDRETERFIRCIDAMDTNSAGEAIEQIALSLSNSRIEDYTDQQAENFVASVKKAVNTIRCFEQENVWSESGKDCNVRLEYEGEIIEKNIENKSISSLGNAMMNELDSIFEDYGGALEISEQVAILLKKLKSLLAE